MAQRSGQGQVAGEDDANRPGLEHHLSFRERAHRFFHDHSRSQDSARDSGSSFEEGDSTLEANMTDEEKRKAAAAAVAARGESARQVAGVEGAIVGYEVEDEAARARIQHSRQSGSITAGDQYNTVVRAAQSLKEFEARAAAKTASWRGVAHHSDMYGFDQVIAVSQAAINQEFRSRWVESRSVSTSTSTSTSSTLLSRWTESLSASTTAAAIVSNALLWRWTYKKCFEATFQPLSIRLRNDGKAVFFVHICEGC